MNDEQTNTEQYPYGQPDPQSLKDKLITEAHELDAIFRELSKKAKDSSSWSRESALAYYATAFRAHSCVRSSLDCLRRLEEMLSKNQKTTKRTIERVE